MKAKIIYLLGYFVVFCLGLFGAIRNLITLKQATYIQNGIWEKWQIMSFAIAFSLIALCGLLLFTVKLVRLLIDIKINKENK